MFSEFQAIGIWDDLALKLEQHGVCSGGGRPTTTTTSAGARINARYT